MTKEGIISGLKIYEKTADTQVEKRWARDAIEYLEQESCDCVSRDAVKKEIKCWIGNGRPRYSPDLSELLSWIDDVPPVQPKPIECDDCVSRGAVVDLLNMRLFGKELFKALYELPSVQPKPNYCAGCKHNTNNEICLECEYDGITRGMTKYVPMSQPSRKGHWILDKDKSLLFNVYKCSNCENIGAKETNFCPNCGADMRGDTDGNT